VEPREEEEEEEEEEDGRKEHHDKIQLAYIGAACLSVPKFHFRVIHGLNGSLGSSVSIVTWVRTG
jgi:hypothetical protein